MVNIADMRNVGNNEEHLILYKQKGRIRKSQQAHESHCHRDKKKILSKSAKKGQFCIGHMYFV